MCSQGNVLKDGFKQYIKELHNVFKYLSKFWSFAVFFQTDLHSY